MKRSDSSKKDEDPFTCFPQEIQEFLQFLFTQNFFVTWVGGGPRDYERGDFWGEDFDFELRSLAIKYPSSAWSAGKQALLEYWSNRGGKVVTYPLEVFKISMPGLSTWSLELSLPRQEVFFPPEHPKAKAHHNFTAVCSLQLPYTESFRRRDFTCNALGIEFVSKDEWQKIDPLQGRIHLSQKILQVCGPDFVKDPVRFLRLLRFEHTLQLQRSKQIQDLLPLFQLQDLSFHYLIQEAVKDGQFWNYLKVFWQQTSLHQIPISRDFRNFFSWPWFQHPLLQKAGSFDQLDYRIFGTSLESVRKELVKDCVCLLDAEGIDADLRQRQLSFWSQLLGQKESVLKNLLSQLLEQKFLMKAFDEGQLQALVAVDLTTVEAKQAEGLIISKLKDPFFASLNRWWKKMRKFGTTAISLVKHDPSGPLAALIQYLQTQTQTPAGLEGIEFKFKITSELYQFLHLYYHQGPRKNLPQFP